MQVKGDKFRNKYNFFSWKDKSFFKIRALYQYFFTKKPSTPSASKIAKNDGVWLLQKGQAEYSVDMTTFS